MIRLHCTKKLLAKLPVRADGRLVPSADDDIEESLLSGWHANLVTLQRRQCVLFVHDATRFPVFLPGLRKDDFAQLDTRFESAFYETLFRSGADEAVMNNAIPAMGRFVCDSDCDRSVQGTMRRMLSDLDITLDGGQEQLDASSGARIAAWLADGPCTVKGRKDTVWPDREMHAFLRASS